MYSDEIKELLETDNVYAIDTLPPKRTKPQSKCRYGVVNLDRSNGPGTHWVCYYNNNVRPACLNSPAAPNSLSPAAVVEYFDSFGCPPPLEICDYLGDKLIYNSFQIQDIGSSDCGFLCVLYIKLREKGLPMLNILLNMTEVWRFPYYHRMQWGGNIIGDIYRKPITGFSGVNEIYRRCRDKDPSITMNDVKTYLQSQSTYQLHKPVRHRFPTRRVYVPDNNNQLQADLVDMREFSRQNGGMKYILTCIDCFNRYCWATPLKNKTNTKVLEGLKSILSDCYKYYGTYPKRLQTDAGTEFIGKPVQQYLMSVNISWFQTYNETKACIVERFNRTLKTKMWKYFTDNDTRRWVEVLDDIIVNCRNSYHRSVKMTPVEARISENRDLVYDNLYAFHHHQQQGENSVSTVFHEGDEVRITVKRGAFRKGYLNNFTHEIFIIKKVLPTIPVTYVLMDTDGDDILGSFYADELVAAKGERS